MVAIASFPDPDAVTTTVGTVRIHCRTPWAIANTFHRRWRAGPRTMRSGRMVADDFCGRL